MSSRCLLTYVSLVSILLISRKTSSTGAFRTLSVKSGDTLIPSTKSVKLVCTYIKHYFKCTSAKMQKKSSWLPVRVGSDGAFHSTPRRRREGRRGKRSLSGTFKNAGGIVVSTYSLSVLQLYIHGQRLLLQRLNLARNVAKIRLKLTQHVLHRFQNSIASLFLKRAYNYKSAKKKRKKKENRGQVFQGTPRGTQSQIGL